MSTLPGWALMNDSAARFAAARRLGATSVAAMLPETSMARMTVPAARDTGTDADGPATAIASTATPTMVNHTPPRRRSEEHTSELQSLTNLVCRLLLEK